MIYESGQTLRLTHLETVSYLFASSGKWYACDWNYSNANWRLCTPLSLDNKLSAKRGSSGRCQRTTSSSCSCLQACPLLIWSIQRLKAYLVSPSLFNCNHFHLSSVTNPKSRACQAVALSSIYDQKPQRGPQRGHLDHGHLLQSRLAVAHICV